MGTADQLFFNNLRAAHYPPERNHLAAHITLFHQLPPSSLNELDRLIRRLSSDTPPPAARLREIYSLGGGVAFRIESPDLVAVHARIADRSKMGISRHLAGAPRWRACRLA